MVDAVLEETGTREKRLRLLASRVVVYFVLALALFEQCSYRATWGKLTAALAQLSLTRPSVSSLSRARRRIGAAPLRRLFETLAGVVGLLCQPGVFYRGCAPWLSTARTCTCPTRNRSPGATPNADTPSPPSAGAYVALTQCRSARPPTNLEPAAVRHGASVKGVRRCPADRAGAGRTAAPWPARRAGAPRRRRG
ncbi:transposase domain-containing protein [Micromonospora coerulea]|uniref:transposase domain-containing protein n=1 Tax=Micromonospora coerulea TaxID=47856 RepID=UPI003556C053